MTTKEFNNVLQEASELESTYKKHYHQGFEDCRKLCIKAISKLNWQEDTWATKTIKGWIVDTIEKVKEKK